MKTALPVVELLEKLVSFPSISGSEAELVAWLASHLEDLGLQPVVQGRNVWVRLAGRSDKQCLLFNSHFDVVPPGVGWDSDPFVPARKGPHLIGRGANDAKGSVAAMIAAVHQLAQRPLAGDVLLALTCDEETGGEGLEKLIAEFPLVTAGVVGEPTFNRPSLGMRGLLSLQLECRGQGCHASRPHEGINPIYGLARDVLALEALVPEPADPVLGQGTLAVTVFEGGAMDARNRVPDVARAIIDSRTTSTWNNEVALAQITGAVQHSQITVRSSRIRPKATAPGEPIAQAAIEYAQGDWYAFRGAADFAYVPAPAVILGPGNTSSHQANEHIEIEMVEAAVEIYTSLATRYFELAGAG